MNLTSQLFGSCCIEFTDDPTGQLPCQHYIKGGYCTLGNHFLCPEYVLRNEPPLSFSMIDTYAACHRRFYWTYLVGLESIDKPWAMKLGSCASTILGWLHDEKLPEQEAINLYRAYIEDLIKETMDPESEEREYGHPDIWKMKAMFDVYIERTFYTNRGTTEFEFRWDIRDNPRVHGYIDLVEMVNYEEHFGWEFKWTLNPDNYSKFLVGDQLCAYFIGDPKIIRMTTRLFVPPDLRQKKTTKKQVGESMLDFYQRMYDDILQRNFTRYFIDLIYWRTEFDLENYQNKAKRSAKEIMSYIDEGKIEPFYQNKKACLNPFKCDFLSICENDIAKPWDMECFTKRGGRKENKLPHMKEKINEIE